MYRRKKTNNDTYLLHPNYGGTTLSNIQRKHHVHLDQKGHLSLIYVTSTILFVLKTFPFLSIIYYCDLPVTNPLTVILQIKCSINYFWLRAWIDSFCSFRELKYVLLQLLALLSLHYFSQTLHSIKYTTILELQLKFFFL